jgi:hypothetical protein
MAMPWSLTGSAPVLLLGTADDHGLRLARRRQLNA